MRDLDAILMFASVASRGSFAAAAKTLNIPKATLSRRIRQLEDDLGVRLLQRNTRRIALTEAGRAFHEHCVRIADEVERAQVAVAVLANTPRGVLRVSAPFTTAHQLVVPMLAEFLGRYPTIRLALTLRNDDADLLSQDADVVLSKSVSEDTQASRMLLGGPMHLFASPSYLRRRPPPETPADLVTYDVLLYSATPSSAAPVLRLHTGDREEIVTTTPLLTCNDLGALRKLLLDGLGIALLPDPFIAADIAEGRLARVLPEWAGPDLALRAVFGSRRGLLPKVRVFVDSLVEVCRRQSEWSRPGNGGPAQ